MVDLMEELQKRKKIIDEEIEELFEGKDHPLWESMALYPLAGGKKLRPFLSMICAGALGAEEKKAMHPGICIELIHNFTLVHDDIMDDDDIRRGRKTLHRKKNMATAINAGDGLFALAFNILSKSDVDGEKIRDLLNEVSSAVVKVAEGQEEDMAFESSYSISEDEFIEMIDKKTSYLFQASARTGAIVAGASEEEIGYMGDYAKKMGIAFQVQDDYLDLVGDQGEIGKPVGSDIRAGKRTLMVIHALETLEGPKMERLIDILESKNTKEEVTEAIDLLEETGSLDYAKKLAENYAKDAKESIEFLPESEYKDILKSLVDFMINRTR